MSALTPSDRDLHARFGINADLLRAAGVTRVTDREARDGYCIGRWRSGKMGGILYPHLGVDGQAHAFRVRRDEPDLDGRAKYLASQDRNAWAFPPACVDRATDTTTTVVIVESEKAMLTIEAAAGRHNRRLLPIALGGAYNWRGRIGKGTAPDGERIDEHGPMRDFQDVTWMGRTAVILFDANTDDDADVQKREQLRGNRAKLGAHLVTLGAQVRIGLVPAEPGCNGPDDYRALHDDTALLALIDDTAPWVPPSQPETGGDGGKRGPSQATKLVELAEQSGATFFSSHDGDGFISVPIQGHRETFPVSSRQCRAWITRAYYAAYRAAPSAQGLSDALGVLGARASFEGEATAVFVRVAECEGSLYLDLGDPTWRAVEITPDGWQFVDLPPVLFRRPNGLRALPVPVRGGSVSMLRPFVNVASHDDFILLVSFLLATLRPTGPYPLACLQGEQGSAKSTTARIVKQLTDPGAASLRSEPKEPRDLMIGAHNGHVLAFDNISHLPVWLSDGLCRLATGGGFSTRKLYSDTDETIIDVQRPVILTGIEEYVTRGDLLDRALLIELPRIGDDRRLTEKGFMADFEVQRPAILGALLDAAVVALRDHAQVTFAGLPRMADFATWSAAGASAFGWTADNFLLGFTRAREAAVDGTLDADSIAEAVRAVALPWSGTATELLEHLTDRAGERTRKAKSWPTSPRTLANALRRLAPLLRPAGFVVDFGKGAKGRRLITLTAPEDAGESSPPSPPSPPMDDSGLFPENSGSPNGGAVGATAAGGDSPESIATAIATMETAESGRNGDGGDGDDRPPLRSGLSADEVTGHVNEF